jgi:hypothetical protein
MYSEGALYLYAPNSKGLQNVLSVRCLLHFVAACERVYRIIAVSADCLRDTELEFDKTQGAMLSAQSFAILIQTAVCQLAK